MKENIKRLWQISWPLIIANSFWNIQMLIDRIFLGQYSTEALGAAIAAGCLYWAPMALVQQTAGYVTTFVAQYLGANKPEWVGPSVWQATYVSIVGGMLFLLLIPICPIVFTWMGHSDLLQSLEVKYFSAMAFSALPVALVATCSGFFTGIGKSKTIMLINASGMVFNIVFDYTLIFGNFGAPALGIAGAGWSTAIANYGAAIIGFYIMLTGPNIEKFQLRKSLKLHFELLGRFVRFGIPSGLQWSLEGLAFLFFLAFIGRMPNGESALSSSSIAISTLMIAILPVVGVGQGVSALVGHDLGEDKPQKAVKITQVGVVLSLSYVLLTGLCFLIFPSFFIDFFKANESSVVWEEVAQISPVLLQFIALFIIFDCMNIIFSFTLKGAGDTRFVSILALTLPWPLMVLPTWYFSGWESGVYWAWGASCLFISMQAIILAMRFVQGKWKSMRVI